MGTPGANGGRRAAKPQISSTVFNIKFSVDCFASQQKKSLQIKNTLFNDWKNTLH